MIAVTSVPYKYLHCTFLELFYDLKRYMNLLLLLSSASPTTSRQSSMPLNYYPLAIWYAIIVNNPGRQL